MKNIFIRFISTKDDNGIFVARVVLALVMLPHGLQKLLGLFGGNGFSATITYFTSSGIPVVLAFLVIMAESLGALALLAGFFGRFMSFGITMNMLGAIFLVHLPNGFFMNWFGTQKGEGFEYHLLALGLAFLVMIDGSGKFSIDRLLHKWLTGDR